MKQNHRTLSESVASDYLPETPIGLIDLLKGTHPQFAVRPLPRFSGNGSSSVGIVKGTIRYRPLDPDRISDVV